ncbi:hypothetical protein PBI_SCTP2_530 [Salicola phage SCTP-2]|nr:hypothetical protein PBI_SCTP2_530 [Salicola phage SCTP-2]
MQYKSIKQKYHYCNSKNTRGLRERIFNHSNNVDSIRNVKDVDCLEHDLIIDDTQLIHFESTSYSLMNLPYFNQFGIDMYELINDNDSRKIFNYTFDCLETKNSNDYENVINFITNNTNYSYSLDSTSLFGWFLITTSCPLKEKFKNVLNENFETVEQNKNESIRIL